ncbi:MAG: dihydropteroate synthase, partial [Spirochaetaceae bacterium]|nr:dihydropteroate synthase [Spirochaetaceae bacterium]
MDSFFGGGCSLVLGEGSGQGCFVSTPLPALIMGIVNATPDSFWQGSRGSGHQAAELALQLVEEGAHIIDLGAESTRPGSSYIGEDQELERLIPVIQEIRRHSQVPLSIDTRKQSVMAAAWEAGAQILNDVSALEDDPQLGAFAASHGLPVILMHKRGIPATMQHDTSYDDAFGQVDTYLQGRVAVALSLGIQSDRIWIDPGIGFGKDFQANRILVARCGQLCGGRFPVVMGLSRKSFVAQLVAGASQKQGERPPESRLSGTLAANMMATIAGASVLRVHDVAATRDMISVSENLRSECVSSVR